MEKTRYLCTYVCICSSMELLVQKMVCILYLHRIFIMLLYSHYEHYSSSCLKSIRHRSSFSYLFPVVVESLGCCWVLFLEIMTWPHLWAESQDKDRALLWLCICACHQVTLLKGLCQFALSNPRGVGHSSFRLVSKNGVFGISKCKLLYIGWITTRSYLLYTGNYIQYLC